MSAPAPHEPTLLDLVRQLRKLVVSDYAFIVSEAEDLLDRIAALVPQPLRLSWVPVQARDEFGTIWQPVQARDEFGTIWQHSCGMTGYGPGGSCPGNCGEDGPWHPLYVAADAAPDGDRTSEPQPDRAPEGWVTRDGIQHPVAEILLDMQQREAQVMAELGVTEPGEVLGALERRFNALVKTRADREQAWKERDEARAEVERLKADVKVFTDVFGAKPDPLVLSLPEVPEGAVALVGERRWVRGERVLDKWKLADGSAPHALAGLGAVLDTEGGTVRVELAPSREPRTAAEIWAGMGPMDRLVGAPLMELAEALDREAGL